MCSPGAAKHTGPGNLPKGTDQSVQEAFHQETRNNFMGWQEGIKNKPICWTMVAFINGVSVTGAFWPLPENVQVSSDHLGAGVLITKGAQASQISWKSPVCSSHWISLGAFGPVSTENFCAGLTQGQCCCPAFLFLILVRKNWWILITTPNCGHADISFLSSSIWKSRSFQGQGEDLCSPHPPSLSCCRVLSTQTRALLQQHNSV